MSWKEKTREPKEWRSKKVKKNIRKKNHIFANKKIEKRQQPYRTITNPINNTDPHSPPPTTTILVSDSYIFHLLQPFFTLYHPCSGPIPKFRFKSVRRTKLEWVKHSFANFAWFGNSLNRNIPINPYPKTPPHPPKYIHKDLKWQKITQNRLLLS